MLTGPVSRAPPRLVGRSAGARPIPLVLGDWMSGFGRHLQPLGLRILLPASVMNWTFLLEWHAWLVYVQSIRQTRMRSGRRTFHSGSPSLLMLPSCLTGPMGAISVAKGHLLMHLALSRVNPASHWCYRDEAFGHTLALLAKRRGGEVLAQGGFPSRPVEIHLSKISVAVPGHDQGRLCTRRCWLVVGGTAPPLSDESD